MIVGERVISNLWIVITKCGVLSIASVDAGSGQESIRALMVWGPANWAYYISNYWKTPLKNGCLFSILDFLTRIIGWWWNMKWFNMLRNHYPSFCKCWLYIYSYKHTHPAFANPQKTPSFSRQLQQSRITWVPGVQVRVLSMVCTHGILSWS